MKEEWKPIKGYEEVYEVSNLGLVRRKKKTNSGDVGSLTVNSEWITQKFSEN